MLELYQDENYSNCSHFCSFY